MICPACKHELRQLIEPGAVRDYCAHCGGYWFDAGELKGFLDDMIERLHGLPYERIELRRAQRAGGSIGSAPRPCPCCDKPMAKTNYAYDSNVFVDRCTVCGGIWVDKDLIVPLATYTRGHPKLDKLGESLAQDVRRKASSRETIDVLEGVGSMPYLWYLFPKIVVPLGDTPERRSIPCVTLGLILANVLVYLIMLSNPANVEVFVSDYAMVPSGVMEGQALHTFVTSAFLHAGVLHLVVNMLFLYIFGDNVEDAFGHLQFLVFYFFAAIASSAAHVVSDLHSTTPCLGASGAVAGVMGTYLVFHPDARIRTLILFRVFDIPAVFYLGLWFLLNLVNGVLSSSGATPTDVAWFAHIGGFAFGVISALAWKLLQSGKMDSRRS